MCVEESSVIIITINIIIFIICRRRSSDERPKINVRGKNWRSTKKEKRFLYIFFFRQVPSRTIQMNQTNYYHYVFSLAWLSHEHAAPALIARLFRLAYFLHWEMVLILWHFACENLINVNVFVAFAALANFNLVFMFKITSDSFDLIQN